MTKLYGDPAFKCSEETGAQLYLNDRAVDRDTARAALDTNPGAVSCEAPAPTPEEALCALSSLLSL